MSGRRADGDGEDVALLGTASASINRPLNKTFMQELIKACAAEFLATMLFVFVGVTAIINLTTGEGPNASTDITGVALAHGLMIFLMISITGHVR